MYQFFNLFRGVAKMETLEESKEALSTKNTLNIPFSYSKSSVYPISPQNIEKIVHWYTLTPKEAKK